MPKVNCEFISCLNNRSGSCIAKNIKLRDVSNTQDADEGEATTLFYCNAFETVTVTGKDEENGK